MRFIDLFNLQAVLLEIISAAIKPLLNGYTFISDGDKVAIHRQP